MVPFNHLFFQYCDSNIGLFFIAPYNSEKITFTFTNAFKSIKERQLLLSPTIVGRAITIWEAIQKRIHEQIYKTYTKIQGIKSDNFCYRKVGIAINKWEALDKSPILLSQYWKNYNF